MQYEVDLYQTESNCQTPLERQYHTEIMATERSKRRQNQRIFTYTDFDRFSKWEEVGWLLFSFLNIKKKYTGHISPQNQKKKRKKCW